MNGRICVVTGATHGIGRATARALAASGATVLVHGRDLARARAVAGGISRDTGNPEVRFVQADFAQLAQVRRLARSEEHTSELQSQSNLVCRLLLEKKKKQHHLP